MEGECGDNSVLFGQEPKLGKGAHCYLTFFSHCLLTLNKMPWDWLYTDSGVGHLRRHGKRGQEVALDCVGR